MKARAVLTCLAAAALFGAAAPAAKALLSGVGPVTLAGLLYLGAAAALLPSALRAGRPTVTRRARTAWLVGVGVLFGGVLGPLLLMLSLAVLPAASVSLWLPLEAVATTLLAAAFFREHLGLRAWTGLALVVAAGVLMAGTWETGATSGALLVAGACLCWGVDNNVTSLVDGVTPAQVTLVKGTLAGAFNFALGSALESGAPSLGTIAGALLLGALGYGLSLTLYIGGAQALGAARSQALFATAPFAGALVAWTVFGEPVLSGQVLGGALVACGLALWLGTRHEHVHAHEPVTHVHGHRHDDLHHDHAHEGLPASTWHVHEHAHGALTHAHPHEPDLHHRHGH